MQHLQRAEGWRQAQDSAITEFQRILNSKPGDVSSLKPGPEGGMRTLRPEIDDWGDTLGNLEPLDSPMLSGLWK